MNVSKAINITQLLEFQHRISKYSITSSLPCIQKKQRGNGDEHFHWKFKVRWLNAIIIFYAVMCVCEGNRFSKHFLKMYSTFLPSRHMITLLCNCWWLKQPHLIIDGLALIILYIYLNIHTGQASEVSLSGYVTTKQYLLHTDNLIHLDHL